LNFGENALRIVVLSGPIGAGKSALAEKLVARYGATVIKTRDLIRKRFSNMKEERAALQRAGERLDRADGGEWVRNGLVRFIEEAHRVLVWVILADFDRLLLLLLRLWGCGQGFFSVVHIPTAICACDLARSSYGQRRRQRRPLGQGARRWSSERRQHAGQDFEPQVVLVRQAVGATLDDSDLVIEPFDKAE
jgi:hypothetical protein